MAFFKNVFIFSVLVMNYFAKARFVSEVHELEINERGTKFNETVEINVKEGSVIFKVPAHNNVAQSDTLFDFKTGYFATRITKLKECHIKKIPIRLFPPTLLEKKNIEEFEKFKRNNFNLPVKTVEALVVKQRKISREELSAGFLKFCGDHEAYEVKEIYHKESFVPTGKIRKRESVKDWSNHAVAQSFEGWIKDKDGKWKKITLNTCKQLNAYFPKLTAGGCDKNPDSWLYDCHARTETCMYNFKCKLQNGKIRCLETHFFTGITCCDVKCPGQ